MYVNAVSGDGVADDNGYLIAVDNGSASVCVAWGNQIWIACDRTKDNNFSQCQFAWKQFAISSQIASIACFGDTLAIGEQSGYIRIYLDTLRSAQTNQLPTATIINWHQSPITLLEISNNGRILTSGYFNLFVQVCTYSPVPLKRFS